MDPIYLFVYSLNVIVLKSNYDNFVVCISLLISLGET